ncbi:MAG TPA: AAA family ATPase, partial [Solirubrobacteraceae bacterium]
MSTSSNHRVAMIGRGDERERLDRLVSGARAGESAVLVLLGAAGAGKTALLEYMANGAEGVRVVRAAGAEAEMELPFAGLHQLCASLLDRLDELPGPQADALGTAFGLSAGPQPDRFLIGLGVLTLLSEAAEELPVLCLVDDAQWLDQSSALVLAFVARRLRAEGVVLLFAVREAPEVDELRSLPTLRLEGLSDADARTLLASVIGAPLDERVRARILAEARGNPLALLELPRELSLMRPADGFGAPADLGLQSRIEASFRRRVQELPAESRRLLLLAAAEPTGEPALLWRTAAELSIPTDAVGPAVGDGILELGTRITFRHPLMRSAVYGSASADDRRAAHRALAAVTGAELDPDRRAWHLARAVLAPDENIADELERSADRAQARGGLPAAAAFLQRAAALSVEPGKRARRALAAAEAKQLAGSPREALSLLASASEGTLGESDRAMLQRLHGQIALDLRRAGDAVPLLLDAARRLEPLDQRLMRETYLEALRAASVAGRLGGGVTAAAKAARSAPGTPGPPNATDLLLDGLAVRFTNGYVASAPALTRALSAIRDAGARPGPRDVRWPWVARRVAPDLFDDDTWHVFATGNVQTARDAGALAVLPLALNYLSLLRCFEGKLAAAEALLDEADEIADATESAEMVFGRTLLAGCRGDEQRGLAVIEAAETAAIARNEGVVLTFGEHARALLYNGLGQHAAAVVPAESASVRDEL